MVAAMEWCLEPNVGVPAGDFMRNACGVYAIRHKASGRQYVGASACIPVRWAHHLSDLEAMRSPHTKLQVAWTSFGREEFEFVVLETTTKDDLFETEMAYLRKNAGGFNSREDAEARERLEQRRRRKGARRTPTVYSARELAEITGYSQLWIYSLAKTGKLPGVIRLGKRVLFSRRAVDKWLAGAPTVPDSNLMETAKP